MEKVHPLDLPGVRAQIIADLQVTAQVVTNWKLRDAVPVEHCAAIEAATGGKVSRKDLRPNDWHRIWPELIDSDGAPAIPEPEARAA